jgi:hypothetical protein
MNEAELFAAVEALAAGAGIDGVRRIDPIAGGRNSRAYRVETGARTLFLKEYAPLADDPRPRLETEYAFLQLAWDAGIRVVPEPIAADPDTRLGLYSFVDGRVLRADEVSDAHVEQALAFLTALNRLRSSAEAATLAPAAEACFAFAQHLRLVDARVRRLEALSPDGAVEAEASSFVMTRLLPLWTRVAERARRLAADAGFANEPPLPAAERCLSPSDFGFHNALIDASGRLVFHDFEYAGWDDPAKLVADFFLQPERPVPPAYRDAFEARIAEVLKLPQQHRLRSAVLTPVFAVKWICIALNDFLPLGERRRAFADPNGDRTERRRAQLRKAEERLRQVEVGLGDSSSAGE